ncbi:hypothetical protein SAMN05720761_11416 [Fibrobacter sp. UWCM]|nr:hypothetical protein [Fibrobacter sp. UWCM]SHH39511.1 hypothetical protein SAMN05720761_11416 [Fibrobacter sp. UWCM]
MQIKEVIEEVSIFMEDTIEFAGDCVRDILDGIEDFFNRYL